MTNYEMFKDELIEILTKGNGFGVKKGIPVECQFSCKECAFDSEIVSSEQCKLRRRNWLCSSYIEPVKINEHERIFCKMVKEGYLARDFSGKLYWYIAKPTKMSKGWENEALGEVLYLSKGVVPERLFKGMLKFEFVKADDSEPWTIEKILEVAEDED